MHRASDEPPKTRPPFARWLGTTNDVTRTFLAAGQTSASKQALNTSLDMQQRLRTTITGLNDGRLVLVLDNFENNLDDTTRDFLDADIKYFYKQLLDKLTGNSRVIVTSRYLPAGVQLPKRFTELSLGEFSETSYFKFLFRDDEVKRQYSAGR